MRLQNVKVGHGNMHFFLSTREAKVDRSLWVRGHPALHCEFQDSQSYTVRPWLEKIIKNEAKKLQNIK